MFCFVNLYTLGSLAGPGVAESCGVLDSGVRTSIEGCITCEVEGSVVRSLGV